jgi:hypothetical protein
MDLVDRLQHARVLVAVGELRDAEREVASVLDVRPDDLAALSLYAKIKHLAGELTLAIACWAQLHARTASEEAARLHIHSLLALARAPAKNAGDFLVMGQHHLVRKPAAYLELEIAFQLYLARRPVEARQACQLVAEKYRGRDRDVYKLAMLSDAWISEHIGELEAACATLEQLGTDRELAADMDRVLTLASLYERIGTRERLEAAMHIYRFLERTRAEGAPIYGYLARGYRRLGDEARAERYEALHLDAFRRGMDRPSAADVLAVAAHHYLPLARLRAPFEEDHAGVAELPHAELSPRERALASALDGDHERADAGLAALGGPVDLSYRADLAFAAGRSVDARAHLAAAIRAWHQAGAAPAPWAVGQLIDSCAAEPGALIALLGRKLADVVAHSLEERLELAPADPRSWRWLAVVRAASGSHPAELDRYRSRAAALGENERGVGHALAAAVYQFVGKPKGIIHEIWAGREAVAPGTGGSLPPENLHGNLSEEMRRDVRNIFVAVREYARAKLPHVMRDADHWAYSFKVTKEDETSGGRSAGLPTALAFLSLFLQRPIRRGLAASGAMVTDSHQTLMVMPVGDVEYKVRAAYHCHLRSLLLPAGNRVHLGDSPLVPRGVRETVVEYVATLDDAVRAAFGDDVFL